MRSDIEDDCLDPHAEAELLALIGQLKGGIGHLDTDAEIAGKAVDVFDVRLPESVEAARSHVAGLLRPWARPAWIPIVETGESDHPVSKYFGAPWMADDEEWPRLMGRDARFVLQLDLSSLPSAYASLPGGGLLQLFSPDDETIAEGMDRSALSLVRKVHPSRTRGRNRVGPVPWCGGRPRTITGWQEIYFDQPHRTFFTDMGMGDDVLDAIASDYGVSLGEMLPGPSRGDKLGGWPLPSSGGLEEPLLYLFQLDSRSSPSSVAHAPGVLSDTGTASIMVSVSDPSFVTVVPGTS